MSSFEIKKTPLYEDHKKLGARMVEFAGWEMPIQYIGLKEEHLNVRKNVGLFDVSHMGEIRFKGPKAFDTLQYLTTNDVSKLEKGAAQYSLLPNSTGGLVDDIIVYCIEPHSDYLVCVNASNKDKDLKWMSQNNLGADISDESSRWGQIAIQGPKAALLIQKVLNIDILALGSFKILPLKFNKFNLLLATTGYTGEKGCEIFIEAQGTSSLWNQLLSEGKEFDCMPIGLGARDTLRTEKCYSLYGHEISDETNPYSAQLGWVIKPQAKNFIGKNQMLNQRESGLKEKLVGIRMLEKGIPRQNYDLYSAPGDKIGRITSGTHSPSLEEPIGIGYVQTEFSQLGQELFVDIRGKKVKAVVSKVPFV